MASSNQFSILGLMGTLRRMLEEHTLNKEAALLVIKSVEYQVMGNAMQKEIKHVTKELNSYMSDAMSSMTSDAMSSMTIPTILTPYPSPIPTFEEPPTLAPSAPMLLPQTEEVVEEVEVPLKTPKRKMNPKRKKEEQKPSEKKRRIGTLPLHPFVLKQAEEAIKKITEEDNEMQDVIDSINSGRLILPLR